MKIYLEIEDGKVKADLKIDGKIANTHINMCGEIYMDESENRIFDAIRNLVRSLEPELKDFEYKKSLDIKADARIV